MCPIRLGVDSAPSDRQTGRHRRSPWPGRGRPPEPRRICRPDRAAGCRRGRRRGGHRLHLFLVQGAPRRRGVLAPAGRIATRGARIGRSGRARSRRAPPHLAVGRRRAGVRLCGHQCAAGQGPRRRGAAAAHRSRHPRPAGRRARTRHRPGHHRLAGDAVLRRVGARGDGLRVVRGHRRSGWRSPRG